MNKLHPAWNKTADSDVMIHFAIFLFLQVPKSTKVERGTFEPVLLFDVRVKGCIGENSLGPRSKSYRCISLKLARPTITKELVKTVFRIYMYM